MKLKFVKEISEPNVSEAQIQREFETNLSVLEENLQYVDSFIRIGNGIVDALALDEDLRPVLIEFKKPEASEQDALIQVLDYYTWCVENLEWLEERIRKTKPDLLKTEEKPSEDIRIMVIARDFEDRVVRIASALEPDVELVSYNFFEKSAEEMGLTYTVVLDTRLTPAAPPEIKTIEDHFRGREKMRTVYDVLVEKVKSMDSQIEPKPAKYSITFKHSINFMYLEPRKDKIRLTIIGLSSEPASSRITTVSSPWALKGKWGITDISKVEEIDNDLLNWIRHAYERAV